MTPALTSQPSPPAQPTAPPVTPGPEGSIEPSVITTRHYLEPSLVTDTEGFAHVAAQRGNDIYYLTNRSGSWASERLTRAARDSRYVGPLIALDSDGSLGVAYTLGCRRCAGGFPDDVYFTTNRSGNWSEQVRISGGWGAALQLDRGAIHLAYNDGNVEDLQDLNDMSRPLYTTNSSGSWIVAELAKIGSARALRLSSGGGVHAVFTTWDHSESDRVTFRYATAETAGLPFDIEPVPLPPAEYGGVAQLDPDGRPHIVSVALEYDAENDRYVTSEPVYTHLSDGAWSQVPIQFSPSAIAIDDRGAMHAVDGTIAYSTYFSGAAVPRQLGCCPFETRDGEWTSETIAVDGSGRPHVLFGTEEGTWYGIGPAG
jgi:hypothetical protein